MSRSILVTGFEPFGGASLNPSQLIVEELASAVTDLALVTAVLPVEYDGAADTLLRLIDSHQPGAVVCLGQAEGRTAISVEKVAINLDDARLADNAGELRADAAIAAAGPAGIFTTLPVRELIDAANAVGVPAGLSLSAGAFVCNHLFYRLQSATADTGVLSGFIHVPLVPEQADEFPGQPAMPLVEQVRGVTAMLTRLSEF